MGCVSHLLVDCCLYPRRDVHRLYELLVLDDSSSRSSRRLSEEDEALRRRAVEVANTLDAVAVKVQADNQAAIDAVNAALPSGSPTPRITAVAKQVCVCVCV